jgi:hypothetical protein
MSFFARFSRRLPARSAKKILIALTVIICLICLSVIWRAVSDLKSRHFLRPPHRQDFNQRLNPQELAGWMTFDFINKAFHLPPDYLQRQLIITDKKYPALTIDSWAKSQRLNSVQILQRVKMAIADFANEPRTN